MPLADYTAIANLALDHLGEPYLTAYETDTTVAAQAARLHLPQCIETVLEGHVWSFATRCQQLTTAQVTETTAELVTGTEASNNAILWTAIVAGTGGNDISVEVVDAYPEDGIVTVDGNKIIVSKANLSLSVVIDIGSGAVTTALPFYSWQEGKPMWKTGNAGSGVQVSYSVADGGYKITKWSGLYYYNWFNESATPDGAVYTADPTGLAPSSTAVLTGIDATAAQVIAAAAASTAAALLVTAENSGTSDGTGAVSTLAATNLSGGSSTSSVYAPAFGSAFNLPSDCLRVIKLDGTDIDVPQNRWEIQGRHLLLEETDADAPVIHYITNAPPVDEWPTTFTDAVAFLLASRLAPKLAQDQSMAADFLQKHEMALGKARSKDSRETRSKENFGPRQLAARSGLVRARYGNPRPPY